MNLSILTETDPSRKGSHACLQNGGSWVFSGRFCRKPSGMSLLDKTGIVEAQRFALSETSGQIMNKARPVDCQQGTGSTLAPVSLERRFVAPAAASLALTADALA